MNSLRNAGDCEAVQALTDRDFENATETTVLDWEQAKEDCELVGVIYPTPKPGKVVVKERGSRNTRPFTLAPDGYDVVIKGSGSRGNVAITLMTVSGDWVDLLVNEISKGGSYRYETAQYDLGCSTSEGCYYLDATMPNGAWSVTFTPMS